MGRSAKTGPLRLACPKCRRGTFGNAPTVAGVRKTGLVEGREYSTHGWSGHRGQVECLDCGHVWYSTHRLSGRRNRQPSARSI